MDGSKGHIWMIHSLKAGYSDISYKNPKVAFFWGGGVGFKGVHSHWTVGFGVLLSGFHIELTMEWYTSDLSNSKITLPQN